MLIIYNSFTHSLDEKTAADYHSLAGFELNTQSRTVFRRDLNWLFQHRDTKLKFVFEYILNIFFKENEKKIRNISSLIKLEVTKRQFCNTKNSKKKKIKLIRSRWPVWPEFLDIKLIKLIIKYTSSINSNWGDRLTQIVGCANCKWIDETNVQIKLIDSFDELNRKLIKWWTFPIYSCRLRSAANMKFNDIEHFYI